MSATEFQDYCLEQAAEFAVTAFLRSKTISWLQPPDTDPGGRDRIYRGLESFDTDEQSGEQTLIQLPCVIATVDSADPVLPNFHGNWNASLRLQILSQSDKVTGDMHAARVREIERAFFVPEIAYFLSEATPFFFVTKVSPGSRNWQREERYWRHNLSFVLLSCCTRGAID